MKNGQKPSSHVTMKDMEQLAERAGLELHDDDGHKRVYRKAAELPDPRKSHRAEVNRKTKATGLRLPPSQLEKVDELAKDSGETRAGWIARVVNEAIEKQYPLLESKNEPDGLDK